MIIDYSTTFLAMSVLIALLYLKKYTTALSCATTQPEATNALATLNIHLLQITKTCNGKMQSSEIED